MIYTTTRWVDDNGKTILVTLDKGPHITIEEQNMRINVCYMPGHAETILDKAITRYAITRDILYMYVANGNVMSVSVDVIMAAYTYNHESGEPLTYIVRNGKSLLPGEERLNVNEQELIGRINSQRQTIGELHKEKAVLEIRVKDLESMNTFNLGRIDKQRQVIGQLEAQISDLEELCGERLNRIDEQRKMCTNLDIDAQRLKVKLEISLAAEESLKKQRDRLQNQMEFIANRASPFASGKKGPAFVDHAQDETSEEPQVKKTKTTWPLGIHMGMDKMVMRKGYGHWCCTSPKDNAHWMRRDGKTLEIGIGESIVEALGKFDSKNPIGGFMFPMSKK